MSAADPHSYSDLSQGKIKHIDFHATVDFDSRVLHVSTDYQLERPISGPLFLDSRGVDIKQIYSGVKPIEYEKDMQDPILGERLCLKNLDHADEFTIELTTSPQASALQWLEPKQTAAGKHPFLYSQCQFLHARSIFPCQDRPAVRFTYTAHLRVPNDLTAVMAAASVGTRDEGETKVYSFKMSQPIPSYLFALAVGDLQFKELGPRTGIYAEPPVLEEAAWEFAENEQKLNEVERLFGPYLWDRYDLLIMPPSFPYGGMENPRLTFITPLAILGDRTMTSLISHELAHAWTGNLVTNATWEDFWLNEGWTTYVEFRILELIEGTDVTCLTNLFFQGILREAIENFGTESDRTCLKASLRGIDPDHVSSVVPYTKGRLFLSSLEATVGREAFDEFIQKYISTYSFQSLTTEEFIEFLRQDLPVALEQVDIQEWLYKPGFPKDIPVVMSKFYDDVKGRASAYEQGILPVRDDIQNWHYMQKGFFLELLPKKISVEHCRYFESLFEFQQSRNAVLLMLFYRLCIRSGYEEIMPSIERFVARVGRHAWLTPLFQCMLENDWTRNLARPMFESVRERHHPITAAVIDNLLIQAGV